MILRPGSTLICLVIFFISSGLFAQSGNVFQGQARVRNGDVAGAEKEAIQDAMRNAVKVGLSLLLPPATRAANAAVLEKTIIAHSEDYIAQYRILSQSKDPGFVVVSIEAGLSQDKMRQALRDAGVTVSIGRPSVFVIIEEPSPETGALRTGWSTPQGEQGTPDICEMQVIKGLKTSKYDVIQPDADKERISPELVLNPAADKSDMLNQMQRLFDADYLVVGHARTRIGDREAGTGQIKTQAEINLAAVDVRSQITMHLLNAKAEGKGKTISASSAEALNELCQSIVPDLLDVLSGSNSKGSLLGPAAAASSTPSPAGKSKYIELVFENLSGVKMLSELKSEIKPGAKGLESAQLNAMGPGWVSFRVTCGGSAADLASLFSKQPFSSFNLKVKNTSPNSVRFTIENAQTQGQEINQQPTTDN